MNWKSFSGRLFHRDFARRGFQLPTVVLELEPGFVAGARLDRTSKKIKRLGVCELAPGALRPAPLQSNLEQPDEIERAIGEVAGELGGASGALGLLLPDAVVRVARLEFETLPDSAAESDALIRWRLKNLLPYSVDEARLSYEVFKNGTGPVEVLVMVARSTVLAEYQAAVEGLNGSITLILPVTAALLPLLPSNEEGELLVHASGGGLTTVVVRGQRALLWRHEIVESEDAFRTSAGAEAARALASAADRLRTDIERIWVCARPPAPQDLAKSVESATARQVGPLTCPPQLASGLAPEGKARLDRLGLPFAGMVANVR